jgi:hypothetical protein
MGRILAIYYLPHVIHFREEKRREEQDWRGGRNESLKGRVILPRHMQKAIAAITPIPGIINNIYSVNVPVCN